MLALAITLLGIGACARLSPVQHAEKLPAYWDLMSRLDFGRAARAATSGAESRLAESLRRVTTGETARGEALLDSLARHATADSTVQRVALVVLAGLLHTEHRWAELLALPRGGAARRDTADLAGVEAWASAFVGARPPHARFRTDSSIFPIVLSPLGVAMVPVEINGRRFLFWLDTGASLTMISADVAAVAGVAPRSADSLEAVTAVGRLRVLPALLTSLHVGPLDLSDAPAMIVPTADFAVADSAAAGRVVHAKIDGIIGWDLLRLLDVRLDHPRAVLTLRKPDRERLGAARRNLFWLGYPLVRAEGANGAALNFGLDTGLEQSFVTPSLAAITGVSAMAQAHQRVGAIGSDSVVHGEVIQDVVVKVGNADVSLKRVAVHAPTATGFVTLDGVIGSDVGNGGVVRIDATNGVYHISPL
jgi:gag-polyprotein putative aspartyl protease